MDVIYWSNYHKKYNSTSIPSDNGVTVDMRLKESTSITNPILIVSGLNDVNITYIMFGGRRYFVDDRVIVRNNIEELHCSLDILGTYREQILSSKQFIAYCQTGYRLSMTDSRLHRATTYTTHISYGEVVQAKEDGTIVFNCSSTSPNKYTGQGTWYVSASQLATIIDNLTMQFDNVNEVVEALNRFFGGASIQNINSITWLPFLIVNPTYTTVKVGNYSTTVSASSPTTPSFTRTGSISIPWQGNNYLRSSFYNKLSLYLPFIGNIGLDVEQYNNATSINYTYTFDAVDGTMLCEISGSNGEGIQTFTGKVGVSIPIGASGVDIIGGATQTIGSLASMSITGVIDGLSKLAIPTTQTIGTFQSRALVDAYCGDKPFVTLQYYAPNEIFSDIAPYKGAPFFDDDILSNHVGYVQTENATINVSLATYNENICRMLDSGVFIE